MKSVRSMFFFFLLAAMIPLAMLHAGEYDPWIQEQMKLIVQSSDDNLTEDQLKALIQKREIHYNKALEAILNDRSLIKKSRLFYEREIFMLQKLIALNKRRGNTKALLRDEIQLRSYKLLKLQNQMIEEIFQALDSSKNVETFEKKMYRIFNDSQKEIGKLYTDKYQKYLNQTPKSSIDRQIQQNAKEFYALYEINADMLRYFAESSKKIYWLNRYAKMGLLKSVLSLNHLAWVEDLNDVLVPYGMSVVKLLMMLLVSVVIYFIRTVLLGLMEKLLLRFKYIGRYTEEIIDDIRMPLSWLLIVINFGLLLSIYNDFSSDEATAKIFKVLYTIFVTFIVYRALNSIARVRLEHFQQSGQSIRSELFNLSVKIVDVIVIIIGVLFALHFAGVNLTTVLSGLGIGGFAVALAARESLSNFFGTISILMSEVFSQGDWIEADGKEGNVVEIGLRVTTIRTFDNALIAIPNATLANKEVKNWSKRLIGRRIKMKLAVKYDSKREDLQKAIEEIREMLRTHPGIATEKTQYHDRRNKSAKLVSKEDELGVKRTLLVYLDEFADSSINILVYAFTKSTVWREWLETKEDVMYKMMEIIERNNLAFAFPTITIDQPEKSEEEKLS